MKTTMKNKMNNSTHHFLSSTMAAALVAGLTLSSLGNLAQAEDRSKTRPLPVNATLLEDAVAGKLLLKANVGYVYNFGGNWSLANIQHTLTEHPKSSGSVGYGGSFGYIHKSGFGLTVDYLGFEHKWKGFGSEGTGIYTSDEQYNVVTFVPSYTLYVTPTNSLGVNLGLGLGFSVTSQKWDKAADTAAQAGQEVVGVLTGHSNGTTGFILAPQAGLEYNNGLLHLDANVRYLHELRDVKYTSTANSPNQDQVAPSGDLSYTAKSGPVALAITGGVGLNF